MEQKKWEEDYTTLPTKFKVWISKNYLMDATIAAGSADLICCTDLPAIVGYFCGFIALNRDVQTNTEKIRTTQYIPTQNRKGCNEPMTS
jgi:hypothetical protein